MTDEKPEEKNAPAVPVPSFAKTLSAWLRKPFGLSEDWWQHRDIFKNNFELGKQHLAAGNFNDALLRFSLVTWINPAYAPGWFYLGAANVALGKRKKAEKLLVKSLAIDPGLAEAKALLDELRQPAEKAA